MSKASTIPYNLRPNKAVDRELFLALLGRLAGTLNLEEYKYIGLGGPFMEDFRLIHARLGLEDMVSVEVEEAIHQRQKFNKPVPSIKCVHNTLEDYLDSTQLDCASIIWFDYSSASSLPIKIDRFVNTISEVQLNSILRITLNANPVSLGMPGQGELSYEIFTDQGTEGTALERWRLNKFKERIGDLYVSEIKATGMKKETYGDSLLLTLHNAVEKEKIRLLDRKLLWGLADHYADGQPMVTATLIVADPEAESDLQGVIENWPYKSTPIRPHKLNMPNLSTLERLTLESNPNAKSLITYKIQEPILGVDPIESFRRFYRIFPHFARVDL